jgi:integrase
MKLLDQIDQEFSRKYAPTTIARYRPAVVNYLKWLVIEQGVHTRQALSQTGFDECAAYLQSLPRQAASTTNQTLAALMALYKVIHHPVDLTGLRARQKIYTLPEYILNNEQVSRVVHHLNYPHKLIAWLMYASGLTLSECLALRVSDICFPEERAGRAEISDWTVKRLEVWIEDRLLRENDLLFQLKAHQFNKVLKRAAQTSGLSPISSMVLRDSGVMRLYEAGRTEAHIQRWLGVSGQTFQRRYAPLKPGRFAHIVSPLDMPPT